MGGHGIRALAVLVAVTAMVGCSESGSEDLVTDPPVVDDAQRGEDATALLSDLIDRFERADLTVVYEASDGRTEQVALQGEKRAVRGEGYFFLEDGRTRVSCDPDGCVEGSVRDLDVPGGSIAETLDLLQLPLPCHDLVEAPRGNCDLRLDGAETIAGREAVCVEGFLDRAVDRRERRCYDEAEGVALLLEVPGLTVTATEARPATPDDFDRPQESPAPTGTAATDAD